MTGAVTGAKRAKREEYCVEKGGCAGLPHNYVGVVEMRAVDVVDVVLM